MPGTYDRLGRISRSARRSTPAAAGIRRCLAPRYRSRDGGGYGCAERPATDRQCGGGVLGESLDVPADLLAELRPRVRFWPGALCVPQDRCPMRDDRRRVVRRTGSVEISGVPASLAREQFQSSGESYDASSGSGRVGKRWRKGSANTSLACSTPSSRRTAM